MQDPMRVFDRRSVRVHRDRAAALLPDHDFLLRLGATCLVSRPEEILPEE